MNTKKITNQKLRTGLFFVSSFLLFFIGLPAHAAILDVDSILQMFAEFAFDIASVLTKAIVLLIDVMVPIMTYNNFTGNPVVTAGWAIVRDTVNMFFVVVLIIIAFGTIFGHSRFKWQQQVPRLLIFAIVINFSKTLCGIMIDFGQVIMLTFANALREIAAGNFIQLLGLNQIYSVSQSSSVITTIKGEGGSGAGNSFDFFAAGVMSVILTLWVLGTLIVLVAVLLFRIIMLWVLIVMAPLAWFVGGTGDLIKTNAYQEWWTEFKCMVAVGPVLAFFLWLTLAVAGAGNIAANSGFNVGTNSNNADFTSSLLELNNFLSFLIGMALLFSGLKAATQFCSGMAGSMISSGINKYAKRIPQITAGVLGAGAATGIGLGLKGGSLATRGVIKAAYAMPAVLAAGARYIPGSARASRAISSAKEGVKTGTYKVLEEFGKKTGISPIERMAAKRKGAASDAAGLERVAEVKKQKEGLKGMSRDTIAALGDKYANNPSSTKVGEAEAMAILDQAMGDSRLQKQLRDSGSLEKLWRQHGDKFEGDFKHDAAKTGSIKDFKKANADFTGSTALLKNWDDVKSLQDDALKDVAVQKHLKQMQSGFVTKDGQAISSYDAILQGRADAKKASLLGQIDVKNTNVAELKAETELEGQLVRALNQDDASSAQKVITEVEKRYNDPATSDQDRSRMAVSMDRMRASIARTKSQAATDTLAVLDTKRSAMETASGFGAVPVLEQGDSPESYVTGQFGNASKNRIQAAVDQFSTQESTTKTQASQLENQRDVLIGQRTGELKQRMDRKREQVEAIRRKVETDTQQEVTRAMQDVQAAEALLMEAQKSGDVSEVSAAEKFVQDARNIHVQKKTQAEDAVKANPELNNLQAELDQMVDAVTQLDSEQVKGVKEANRKIANLHAQAEKLKKVRERLEQQKAKNV
ncbi:TPA: hypothetical protein DCW61_01890 [Candidatus Uhrbacteria bacterium]|nr:hypothetical protein [Candidatus Uhrbacteria bacterium]